jgi:hypothetical protein
VVVEGGREVHGDRASLRSSRIDRSGQRRRVVDDQKVAGDEVLAEVGEPGVHDVVRRGDQQLDALAGCPARFGRFYGVGRG